MISVCRSAEPVDLPRVAGVAVGVPAGAVQPSPIGVQHDLSVHSRATRCGALLVAHWWMVLCSVGADLLGVCWRNERKSCGGNDGERHLRGAC